MSEQQELIEATLRHHVSPDTQIVAVQERAGGEQGYSGALVRYYDVK